MAPLPDPPADGPTEVRVLEPLPSSQEGTKALPILVGLLERMGFGMEIRSEEDDENVRFDLQTTVYADVLTHNNLELLEAIEHLVDKIVGRGGREERRRVQLDVNGTKQGADVDLRLAARARAERAREEGQTLKLGPLEPRARRIVHLALRDIEGVFTRSEGEGAFRRVCIIPR
jgi:spoIIIJ-associated protein